MEEQNEYSVFDEMAEQVYFEYASTGERLANYLADRVVFYIFIFAFFSGLGIILVLTGIDTNGIAALVDDKVILYSMLGVLHVLFYTLVEGFSKGRSVGKLLTGTRAVQQDFVTPITFKQALIRSLCRIIPFDVLSGVSGRPWHDTISKTYVIKK